MKYEDFIKNKELSFSNVGFEPCLPISDMLFDFQKDIVKWALRKGRACLFEDCGLGKTPQQLEWAKHVSDHTNKPVLILAPLAVAQQTKREGVKFNIPVNICYSQDDVIEGVNITNYEKLHRFVGNGFGGVVLDESSIIKSMSGVIRNQIIDMFRNVPYRLACTATPSPNDYVELGNHAEFLGVMSYTEMLSMFFVNDGGDEGQWRLKKHAHEKKFWEWVCSWAIMLNKPSDLGYMEQGFELPPLNYHEIKIPSKVANYGLFTTEANTMEERRIVRNETIDIRCEKAAQIINKTEDQWLIWANLNKEGETLNKLINNSHEVSGSTEENKRIQIMTGFTEGSVRRLITKPKIAGFGMNWQNCNKVMFVGLSDSWEQLYQAVRRVWRFGQDKEVDVYIVIEEREGKVLENIKRKDKAAKYMMRNIIHHTKNIISFSIKEKDSLITKNKIKLILPKWIENN